MFKPLSFLQPRGKLKFLFLESHGLRSHLSALRWASGRLRKSDAANLSKEQRRLVTEIYSHTRMLTTAMQSMLLVGRLEEQDYREKPEELDAALLLRSLLDSNDYQGMEWVFSCTEKLPVRCDATLLQAILVDVLTLCMEAAQMQKKIFINAHREQQEIHIRFYAVWELPILGTGPQSNAATSDRLLGGTPGLMLSLASAIAAALHGTVVLEEVATEEDDLIVDGTVERGASAAAEYRIAVVLPAA